MSEQPSDQVGFIYHDGGRALSGRRGFVGDCVVRSICIVARLPYDAVYGEITRRGRVGSSPPKQHYSARRGVDSKRAWFRDYMAGLGFEWHKVQSGTPISSPIFASGRFVVDIRRHYTAIINGSIYDAYDCSLGGKRKVCGYWVWVDHKCSCEITEDRINREDNEVLADAEIDCEILGRRSNP